MRNVIVYLEPGRYAGWPANNGIRSWGGEKGRDEIVVGFDLCEYDCEFARRTRSRTHRR